jgi:hypothetical protein
MASYSPEPAILGKPNEVSRISIVAKATSIQTGSSPISQIVPTRDTATNTGLLTCLLENRSGMRTQEGLVPHCGKSKEGATLADWIGEIKKVWARGSSSTLDLARLVSAAKNRLQQHYGQWSRLWKSEQKMPLSKSTADQLAVIGQRMGGLDSQTSENLPRGWNILFCLARLDRETLEQQIQQGFIHPKLTLREAKDLVARLNGKQTETTIRKANFREWLRRSAKFVRKNKIDWEPDERELVMDKLTGLIEEINAVETAIFNPSTFITPLGLLTDQPINHLNHL